MEMYQQLIAQVEGAADDPLGRVQRATDVREMSDRVMDHFVGEARRAGESWTTIGDRLGVSKQAARQRFADRITAPGIRPRLQACLAQAEGEARADGAAEVHTQHLLAGLMAEGVAAAILEKLGLTADKIRESGHRLFGPPLPASSDDTTPAMSAEARSAFDGATHLARECMPGGTGQVGTEHLLATLAMDPGSRARRVLNDLGVDIAAIKRELDCYVGTPRRRRRHGRKHQAADTCSFCGRGTDQLVAGPGVWICASCVDLATEILVTEKL